MQTSKKIIIFIIVLVVLWLGLRELKLSHENQPTTPISTNTTQIPTSSKNTFTGGNFSFLYPKELIVESRDLGTQWSSNQLDGTLLAKVTVPQSIQPQTNLSDSRFTVGVGSLTTNCLVATNGEIEAKEGDVTINGVSYKKFQLGDAGAGNRYDTTSYRTLHDGKCYAVEYTIHSTAIGNYDPNQGITEFDRASITAVLEGMVQSFTFL